MGFRIKIVVLKIRLFNQVFRLVEQKLIGGPICHTSDDKIRRMDKKVMVHGIFLAIVTPKFHIT